jgi:phospholipid/cholesterol/gamma-HCH transport system permease protein
MASIAALSLQPPSDDKLLVVLSGPWKLGQPLPQAGDIQEKLKSLPAIRQLSFDADQLSDWDSGLLTFLLNLRQHCAQQQIEIDSSGLPQGATQLIALATAVPEKKDARKAGKKISFLSQVGVDTLSFIQSSGEMLSFIGEASIAFMKMIRGKAQYQKSELWLTMEACGGRALSIVTLISFLVGLILAFIGAIQLKLFGAEIYVANLVGVAMVRLMAAIMTGVVMAGRTGGAFAAQLGTMQVNQEIDALKTLGISPMEFLVLPRMLALALMMPLLGLYANFVGILGGMLVGVGMLDLNLIQYYHQTASAVRLWDLGIGLFSCTVFGVIVALSGCMRGMQCGRSASAVGDAATSAVVTAIVGIIVATAIITVICNVLGI